MNLSKRIKEILVNLAAEDKLPQDINELDEHVFDVLTPKENIYARGIPVLSSDRKIKGKLTGGTRHCRLEGCTGKALAVRWEDGKLTYPCTKGMDFQDGTWKIM